MVSFGGARGFTFQDKLPNDSHRVIVRPLDLSRIVVVIEPQQESVSGAGPQREATEEGSVIASGKVTEGRAQEQNVQGHLRSTRG